MVKKEGSFGESWVCVCVGDSLVGFSLRGRIPFVLRKASEAFSNDEDREGKKQKSEARGTKLLVMYFTRQLQDVTISNGKTASRAGRLERSEKIQTKHHIAYRTCPPKKKS